MYFEPRKAFISDTIFFKAAKSFPSGKNVERVIHSIRFSGWRRETVLGSLPSAARLILAKRESSLMGGR